MAVSRIDETLDVLRRSLERRREVESPQVETVRRALAQYVDAVDARMLAELCARTGIVPTLPAKTPEEAAMALRAAVDALPELYRREREPSLRSADPDAIESVPPSADLSPPSVGPISTPPMGAYSESRLPAARPYDFSAAPSEGRIRAYVQLDAEGESLKAEFESVEYETLSDADFSSYATEYAAMARLRQERGLAIEGSELESRIIRRLTALAHQRILPRPVFGLSRSHRGDWESIAKRAREERERRAAAPRVDRGERVASYPSSTTLRAAMKVAEEEPADDDAREEEPLELPRLRARAEQSEVVLVGGVVKNEKLDRVRRRTGIDVEWIGLDAGKSAAAVAALAKRIRDGRLAALVLLNGLMDHKQSDPLMSAAREVGLPVAYADKAGKGALVKAFVDLERRLVDGKLAAG